MKLIIASFLLSVAAAETTEINFNFAGILGGIAGIPIDPEAPTPTPTPTPQLPPSLPPTLNGTMPATECAVLKAIADHAQLKTLVAQIVANSKACTNSSCPYANGGLNNDVWVTLVSRNGYVCAVAYSGTRKNNAWPGSRVISAAKANTANAFSLSRAALSTANLYEAVQPGGSLFGLLDSNPINTDLAYRGNISVWGTPEDPMVGGMIGGVNVFGGGLPLYELHVDHTHMLGGIGVSGDTSCADHNIAWRLRHELDLDYVQGGVQGAWGDNMGPLNSNGFGHPKCTGSTGYEIAVDQRRLPAIRTIPVPP